MFSGQPDPNDPSHFTIRYQMWGKEDVLDGRLGDDDQVTLTPRHLPTEPATTAAPQINVTTPNPPDIQP
jgi:hypothetical protein